MGEIRNIEYAKKYGDLVNEYQSVKIMVENNRIANINVLDYDYTDTEINISKEDAIRIFKENGIDVSEDEIELSIENVGRTEYEEGNKLFEEISEEQMKDLELYEIKSDVRKVWRYEDTQNIQYYVDTIDGKVIIPQKFSIEKQE